MILIVEALYLKLEDLTQSKSNGENQRRNHLFLFFLHFDLKTEEKQKNMTSLKVSCTYDIARKRYLEPSKLLLNIF